MIQEPGRIRALFFDYGGTLDAQGIAWRDRFYPLYLQAGLDIEPEVFARAFYASDDSLVDENPVHLNLSGIVHEQVRRVLDHLGVEDDRLVRKISSQFLRDSFASIEKNIPVLKSLKRHFRLGIISNNYGNLENICRETGLDALMDVMVDSNLVGHVKPDPRIFNAGLDALEVEPARSVMVGDSLARDIRGAEAIGMHPVWLKGPNTNEAGQTIAGCRVISGLGEIPALLGL